MPKGMILAAGRGTRLGPLTDELPKPLLPVANLPVMTQGLRCLQAIGIRRVCANLCYRAEQIMQTFGDGREHGVAMHWLVEDEPRGTAGGVKRLQHELDDDLLVIIAGDAMLDVDLAPLLAAHRARGAFASLATIAVANPAHYGVVVADADGRIIRFQEKPTPGTEISRQANTGIYIFEPAIFDFIPEGVFCDFAHHVFPRLLAEDLPFYAFPIEGYWTDIGNPGDYLQASLDFLAGRIHITSTGWRVADNLLAADAVVVDTVLTRCVVGARAVLPPGCVLDRCIVWPDTVLTAPRHYANTILTPWGAYAVDGAGLHALALVG